MARKPNQKKLKEEEKQFKKALIKVPKEFEEVETSIENKEKQLWKFFRPMKELGKKRLKKGKVRHLKHKHR